MRKVTMLSLLIGIFFLIFTNPAWAQAPTAHTSATSSNALGANAAGQYPPV